jgi:hypothetical protein
MQGYEYLEVETLGAILETDYHSDQGWPYLANEERERARHDVMWGVLCLKNSQLQCVWGRVSERERKKRCQKGDGERDAFIFNPHEIQVRSRGVV